MSQDHGSFAWAAGSARPPGGVVSAAAGLLARLTFWMAVCLPTVLVWMLATGIATPGEAATFVGVTGIEFVALVVGRTHAGDS